MANDLMLLEIGGSDYSDPLYGIATPALDLQFAANKALTDVRSGNNLITFTRASSGTFTDSAGVLRSAVTNLLLRSEEFDNSAIWSPSGSSITANNTTAPNGTITADLLIENSASSTHLVSVGGGMLSGTTYTYSVYAKAAGRDWLLMSPGSTWGYGWFNINNGTLGTLVNGGSNPTAAINAVGNGWYRCSITLTAVANAGIQFLMAPSNGTVTYTGNGTSGIHIWGAQLEEASTVGEYVPTTSVINSAPRFDHNPTTGESLGLLVEEQRTNYIRNNTMVGAAAGTPGTVPTNWGDAPTSNGLNRQVIGVGTQNGITYIDIRYSGTATATAALPLQPELGNVTVAATGQSWTASSWLALAGGSTSGLTVVQRVTGRSSVGGFLENTDTAVAISSTLTRYAASITMANASTLRVSNDIVLSYSSGAVVDITLRIGLPQLEQGAFATSAIPTTTAAVTRNADVATITGTAFSGWYRQDEGTVFVDSRREDSVTTQHRPAAYAGNSGNTNRIEIRNFSIGANTRAYVNDGGVTQANFENLATIPASTSVKVAIATKSNDFAAVANGLSLQADTSGTVPVVDRFEIGTSVSQVNYLNGTIRRITYWPTRLSNADLQRITQ